MAELSIRLIAVGDELLMGMTLDTNSHYIARRLAATGLRLNRLSWAADNEDDLRKQIEQAWRQADVVIVTGGLGPTTDDVTRPVIAKCFGDPLVMRDDLAADIKQRYESRGLNPAPGWESMAMFPARARPIQNSQGAAPGIYYKGDEKDLFAIPGVPMEMKAMFEEFVLPKIQRRRKGAYRYSIFRTHGIGQSNPSLPAGFVRLPAEYRSRRDAATIDLSGGWCEREGETRRSRTDHSA
jgi:nicotinamide-nucleotide amidase